MKTNHLWFGLGLALLAGCVGPSRPAVLAAAGIKDSVEFLIYDEYKELIAGLPVLSTQGKAQVGSVGGGLVSLGDAYLLMFPGTVAPGSSAQIEELSLADLPAPLPPYFEPVAVYRVRVERLAYSVPATDWGMIVNIPTPFESLPTQAKAVLAAHPAPKGQNLDQDAMLKYGMNVQSSLTDISYTQRMFMFDPADGEYIGATRGPIPDEKGRLFMHHFIDSSWIHEEDHDQIDWIYVAVQADERQIISACTESGGYWNGSYCGCNEPGMTAGAFEHCYPDPSYQGEPDSRRYENDFDIMTHNVGNVDIYCAGYGYKLCSVVTEARLRQEVIENFGSYPDILSQPKAPQVGDYCQLGPRGLRS